MPQAAPAVGEQNRYGETWDGGRWQSMDRAPAAGRGNSPPVAGNDNELLKQMLTMAGLTAGGMLVPEVEGPALLARYFPTLLRMGGAAAGGAIGRMTGHVPEAAVSATTGRPNASTFLGDAAIGAREGAIGEALPAVAGPVLRAGGRALSAGGRMLGDVPGVAPWMRGAAAAARGITARELGLPGVIQGAAAGGPVAATELGHGVEALGRGVDSPMLGGPGTLSQRVESGVDALRRRLSISPVASHGERLAAGAERYAGAQRATAAQQAAAARGSGLAPDLGEGVSVRMTEPRPQAEPVEFPRWTAPDLPTPPAPPAPPPMPAPLPSSPRSGMDVLRQRTGTGFETPSPPMDIRNATHFEAEYPMGRDPGRVMTKAAPIADPSAASLQPLAARAGRATTARFSPSASQLAEAERLIKEANLQGLPVDADLTEAVRIRNTTGRWPTER